MNSKATRDDIKTMLRDYALRSELQYNLNLRPSFDEVRELLQHKPGTLELRAELNDISNLVAEKLGSLEARISSFASQKELNILKASVENRNNLNFAELNDILDSKANKRTVMSELQKKVNKAEIDAALNQKLDKVQPFYSLGIANSFAI